MPADQIHDTLVQNNTLAVKNITSRPLGSSLSESHSSNPASFPPFSEVPLNIPRSTHSLQKIGDLENPMQRSNVSPEAASSSTLNQTLQFSRAPAAPQVKATTESVDEAERRILEHQYQHTLQELEHYRSAYESSLAHSKELHDNLQEQKTDHNALLHRYTALTDRVAATERSLSQLETSLVQERQRSQQLSMERDEEKNVSSALRLQCEMKERRLKESEAAEQQLRKELTDCQSLLKDESKFTPAVEVRRMREELLMQQRLSITQPLQQLLQSLSLAADTSETRAIMCRGDVLTAIRQLDDKLAHTEATIIALTEYWSTYHEPLEKETDAFLESVVKENKQLYSALAQLQRELTVVKTEMEKRLPVGKAIPLSQYKEEMELQQQRHSSRIQKAQALLQAQTTLIQEHEETIANLLDQEEDLKQELEEKQNALLDALNRLSAEKSAVTETQAEVQRSKELISSLENLLQQNQNNQNEHYVPREEKEELLQRITELESSNAQQESTLETTKQHLRQNQELLQQSIHASEELEAELSSQQEALILHKKRWAADIENLETTHKASVDRLEQQYQARVEELRKQHKIQQERADELELELARRTHEDSEGDVQRRSLESERQILVNERDTLLAQVEELRDVVLQPLRTEKSSLEEALRKAQREHQLAEQRAAELMSQLESEKTARAASVVEKQEEVKKWTVKWESSERERAELQQQLSDALNQVMDLKREMDSVKVSGGDREALLNENHRLEALIRSHSEELAKAHSEKSQKANFARLKEELQTQVTELREQLSCLPPLQNALRALEAECNASKVEVQALREERDRMTNRIKSLVQRQTEGSSTEDELDKAIRDADAVTKRLTAGRIRRSSDKGMSVRGSSVLSTPSYHISAATRAALLVDTPSKQREELEMGEQAKMEVAKPSESLVILEKELSTSAGEMQKGEKGEISMSTAVSLSFEDAAREEDVVSVNSLTRRQWKG